MKTDFEVTFRGDHVHVQLNDPPHEGEPPRDYWETVRKVCEEHDCKRILVEGVVPGGDRKPQDVMEAGARTAVVPSLWLAFHLEGYQPSPLSELYETVAASKGVRVKFFDDSDDALKWLKANAPK